MGKLIMKSAPLSGDPEVKVPSFNFCRYEAGQEYHNDENRIDFVTDGKSLYVCLVSHTATEANIANEQGFLKLVSEGPQGIQGVKGDDGADAVTPIMSAEFVGDQLKLIINNKIAALSPSLTGPSWKPVLEDNVITWELTDDRYAPESIDLETLRPIQKSPLLLRTNSDNTKRSDETSGPANFIQWKYEGDEYWTNLISISELMNLALAGVSVWKNEDDQKWHLGHREVIKATYDSDKNGRKIISNVRLGDVLFDAGELPFAEQQGGGQDYGPDIDLIYAKLAQLEADMVKTVNHVGPDANGNVDVQTSGSLDGYATQNWVSANYQPKGNYVTSVNGVAPQPGSNGAITIEVGSLGSFDVRLADDLKTLEKTIDGTNWISIVDLSDFGGSGSGDGSGMPESEIKHLIGLILEGVLDSAIPEYVQGNDHNYFIRLNDLANYTTATQVASMIRDAMTDNNVDYYRVFTLYQRTNSPTTAPAKPVVGVWEWNTAADTDTIVLKPNHSSSWTNHPENATSATPYLWMTSATYSYLTKSEINTDNQQNPWETPICLTAESGQDGADGDSVEFAYILCTEAEFNNIKNTTPVAEHGDNRPDDLPTYTTPSGNGWVDHPSGISETYPIEAVIIRTKDSGVWSAYSNPTIWSMWGEDGMDGDGVEYIFAVAATNETSIDPDTGKRVLNSSFFTGPDPLDVLPLTDQQIAAYETAGGNYQIDDWCPDGTMKHGVQMRDLNWTDNPSDVGPDQPYEFVAIRKKKLDPVSGQMKWGPFTTPALWGFWGTTTVYQPAETHFKPYTCFAFTRSATDIRNYTVVNPWTHANQTYAAWIAADNTRADGYYENPLAYIVTLDENNNVVPSSTLTWSDTIPAPPGQLYMITNHIGDEASGNDQGWTSPRAWGDASGFQVEYAKSSTETDKVYNKVPNYTLLKLDNYDLDTHPNLNDPDNDGIDEAAWRAAILSAGMGVWGDENDISDPDYMAVCYKKQEGVWSNWQVSRIKGEQGEPGNDGLPGAAGRDGTDIEFIYYRTKNVTKPSISTNAYKLGNVEFENDDYDDIDDALPKVANYANAGGSGWSDGGRYWRDHPSGVTSTYKYEWVSCRRSYYDNGVKHWEPFYTPATLWSRYGENGHDGDGIEYVFFALTKEQHDIVQAGITLNNVNYNGKLPVSNADVSGDSTHGDHTKSEFLPYSEAINITLPAIRAVDDNPGGTLERPYVYCSIRKYKYNGTSSSWGDFGPASWWINVDNSIEYSSILHIENDSESILVNNNNIIDSAYNTVDVNIEDLWLRNNSNLLTIDKIAVNGVDFVSFDGQTITPVSNVSTTIELDATHSVTISYVWAYVSTDRYNTKELTIRLTFTNGSTLSTPLTIPITAYSGDYVGTDILTIFPVKAEPLIKFGTTFTRDFHTTTRASYDYDYDDIEVFPVGDTQKPLDFVENLCYWVAFDKEKETAFESGSYFGPFKVPAGNRNPTPGLNGTLSYDFYFKSDGTEQVSKNAETLIHLRMRHTGNEDRTTNQWSGYANVYFGNNDVTPNNNFLPIDNLIIGVGYNNVVTDREEFKIIYNGSTGQPGQPGPQGDPGPIGPTGKTVRVSVWESGKDYDDGTVAVDGVYYLDVVTTTAISTNGGNGVTYYVCKTNHTSTTFAADLNANKWQLLDNTTPVITPFILADKIQAGDIDVESLAANSAFVNNLTVKHLDGADGTFTGGIKYEYESLGRTNINDSHVLFRSGYNESEGNSIGYNMWKLLYNGSTHIKAGGGQRDTDIFYFDYDNYDQFEGRRFNFMVPPRKLVGSVSMCIMGTHYGPYGNYETTKVTNMETVGDAETYKTNFRKAMTSDVVFLHPYITGEPSWIEIGGNGYLEVELVAVNDDNSTYGTYLFAYIIAQHNCIAVFATQNGNQVGGGNAYTAISLDTGNTVSNTIESSDMITDKLL